METKEILITAVIVALVILLLGGFGGFGMMGYGYGCPMCSLFVGGSFGFMWIFMLIIWALLIIILVLGIVWLLQQIDKGKINSKK